MTKPKLTIKEAKLVKAKAAGIPNAKAYVKAGYSATSKEVAEANTRKVLSRPNVQEALQREMVKQGITLEAIVKPIAEALTADKVVIVGNGEQSMADFIPDHSIRLKASGMAAQFMGIGKTTVEGGIHFHNHVEDQRDKYGA